MSEVKQTPGQYPFSIRERIKSISFAASGIRSFFKQEHNARVHLVATIALIVLSMVFSVSRSEGAVLVLAAGFVWSAELFNTAIERVMDFISEERKPAIKMIKDLSAAAVLVASITAVFIAAIIFIPKV